MKEAIGDLWTYPADYRVITTNGIVNIHGEAIMGRGIAFQAKRKYPNIAKELGELLTLYGNRVHMLSHNLISFPTKNHWCQKSDIELIKRSAQ